MELQVLKSSGEAAKSIQVNDESFTKPFNEPLVHQIVTACLAGSRQGTKGQKTRAEVSGGGKKPWRQKGTGRARAGSIRSPLWRTGGKVFAATTRNFSQKMNKKMYQGALKSIFSELLRQDRLMIVDELALAKPRTKDLIKILANMKLSATPLLILAEDSDVNLFLSARNLIKVAVCPVDMLDPVNLIRFEKILLTVPAMKKVEEMLQ